MVLALQVAGVLLVAAAMALSLAHALGSSAWTNPTPRCSRSTIPASGSVASASLLALTPRPSAAFGWTLAGVVALAASHGVYWVLTRPVNEFWLKGRTCVRYSALPLC